MKYSIRMSTMGKRPTPPNAGKEVELPELFYITGESVK